MAEVQLEAGLSAVLVFGIGQGSDKGVGIGVLMGGQLEHGFVGVSMVRETGESGA